MVNNKKSTRYYSDRHEKAVAKSLNAKVQTSSGSSAFLKGDVVSRKCLVECKTAETEKKSFCIKKEWLEKIDEQCFEMRKQYPILAFNFGYNGENYYILNEKTMKKFIEFLDNESE
jgi:outer membrane biosynthesis protein TonB